MWKLKLGRITKNEYSRIASINIRWFRIFLDFKVSRYCEGNSFWSNVCSKKKNNKCSSICITVFGVLEDLKLRQPKGQTQDLPFWLSRFKVLKYSKNCSFHNTLIPNLVKPLTYILWITPPPPWSTYGICRSDAGVWGVMTQKDVVAWPIKKTFSVR